jgi:hypothetical protein
LRICCSITLTGAVIASTSVAEAKPSKEDQATKLEQKALRTYVAGDLAAAVRSLEHAVKLCESGCSSKTKAHLHMSLGTVRGVGEGDYGAAKKEFVIALTLDPEARLRTLTTPALTQAFEDAKAAVATTRPGGATVPPEKPPEKPATIPPEKAPEKPAEKPPEKPVSVADLFHPDENKEKEPSATTKKVEATVLPNVKAEPPPRFNWLAVRLAFDFGFLSDADICRRGSAPAGYYCTDENNQPFTWLPQPNPDVSSGFAFSGGRLLLGYERLLFAGLTAGAFLGVSSSLFSSAPAGRASGTSPFSLEARFSYAFRDHPYVDDAPEKFHPFVFGSLGVQDVDTHVIIRVNEIPCTTRNTPACKHDLNAYRLSEGLFGSLGGGIRYKLFGRHALRGAMKAAIMFGDGSLYFSPELGYEFGI